MAKSIIPGSDTFWDARGVTVNSTGRTLNDYLAGQDGVVTWNSANVSGDVIRKNWWRRGHVVMASLEFTPLSGRIANGNVIATGLPIPYAGASTVWVYGENGGQQMVLDGNGQLLWYFPSDTTTLRRIDITLMYFVSPTAV